MRLNGRGCWAHFTTTIETNAAASDVFRYVADFSTVAEWDPTVEHAIRLDKGPLGEGARFEVLGVPVAWLPVLRLPDPTLARSSGFLAPRFSSDDLLGTGVTVPFLI